MVTDIGGLNDRGFNALAYKGLQQAKADLGADIRVVTSKSNADYVPNLSSLARQKYDLVVAVGFLMGDADRQGGEVVPADELRDRRLPVGGAQGQAQERPRAAVQGERGGLPRGLHGRSVRQEEGRRPGRSRPSAGRRCPRSTPTSRAIEAGAKKANPGVKTLNRLLAGLRRSGEVQGDRAQPDRPGLAGRLRGRGPVRPRRARRRQGEERPGRSASTPTSPTSARR